ncbi:MAG: hypothetical protein ACOX5W_07235 [Bacillota bacterium]|jgi:hypothetical protein
MNQKIAKWPTDYHLDQVAETLQSALDEAICWRLVVSGFSKEKNGHIPDRSLSRIYCWERDASKPLRHQRHYLKVTQLQVKFIAEIQTINIDFLCIPNGERGKGIGKKVVNCLFLIIQELGYNKVLLHSYKSSVPFWTKMGFCPVAPESTIYPKRMFRNL